MGIIKTVYCDFDGTVTKSDAVNTFFEMYADEKWLESEDLWIAGKISSMENAVIQVGLIRPVSQKQLDDYIESIEIDDYFLEFVRFLNKNGIKLVILSDGFDLFINKTDGKITPLYFLLSVMIVHSILAVFSKRDPQLGQIIASKIQLFKRKIPGKLVA